MVYRVQVRHKDMIANRIPRSRNIVRNRAPVCTLAYQGRTAKFGAVRSLGTTPYRRSRSEEQKIFARESTLREAQRRPEGETLDNIMTMDSALLAAATAAPQGAAPPPLD